MYAKVGVLSNGKVYSGEYGIAQIAAVHEFGASPRVTAKMRTWFFENFGIRLKASTTHIRIPARSFLRNTLFYKKHHFAAFIYEKRQSIIGLLSVGDLNKVLFSFGAKWVEYVHEAFDTAGFGTWAPLKSLTWTIHDYKARLRGSKKRRGDKTLMDTGSLRQAITNDVVSE
jgi:phage gpG-like protein